MFEKGAILALSINTDKYSCRAYIKFSLECTSMIIRANPPGVKSQGRQTYPNETLTMPAGHDYTEARDMVTLLSDPTTRTQGLVLSWSWRGRLRYTRSYVTPRELKYYPVSHI